MNSVLLAQIAAGDKPVLWGPSRRYLYVLQLSAGSSGWGPCSPADGNAWACAYVPAGDRRCTTYPRMKRPEPLATPGEVSAFLRMEPHTLANWRSQGVGPGYLKLGNGRVRYDWAAVARWLAAQPHCEAPRALWQGSGQRAGNASRDRSGQRSYQASAGRLVDGEGSAYLVKERAD
jgi:hypothetical protein